MHLSHIPRPTPAFVVAVAALVVALGGHASSLPGKGSVDHDDLGAHVVHRKNLHDNAVNGAKVAESTLGTVPNAAKVNGMTLRKFHYHVFDGGPVVSLLSFSGFELTASCIAGEIALTLHGAEAPVVPSLKAYVIDTVTGDTATTDATFQGDPEDLLAGSAGTSLVGQAQVVNTDSATGSPVITINYHADEYAGADECVASGTIIIG